MIDGMTLLHTFERTTGTWTVIGLWVAFALLAAATLYAWIVWINRRGIKALAFTLAVTLLCVLSLAFAFGAKPTTETLYKVTIDHSVSYREFTYYYEVVDTEGEIYTIREISQDFPKVENNETEPAPIEPTSPITQPTETEPDPTWDSNAVG